MSVIGYVALGISGIAILVMLCTHLWVIPRIREKQQREEREYAARLQLQTAAILSLRGEEELSKKVRDLESIEDIADVVKESERLNREDSYRKL